MAFGVWLWLVFWHLPLLKLDLTLTDQLLAPHFLILNLILVIVWPLSGPVTAVTLSVLAALSALYLSLGVREPSFALQALEVAGLFTFMVLTLYEVQKRDNRKQLTREKLIEDLHLLRDEQRKNEALRVAHEAKIHRFLDLQSFSRDLKNVQGGPEVAARRIVQEAREVLSRADECALYLVDESRQELSLMAGVTEGGEPVREKEGSIFDQWVMKRYRPIMIDDACNDFRFSSAAKSDLTRLRSVCAAPLMTENKVLGVLRASSHRENVFNSDDLRILDIVSNLGAAVLRNMLLYEKTEELALRDSLTGLYLNRHFQARLSEEMLRSNLNRMPFSLALMDIDHFKRYNDEYGHSAGDIVLKNIAAILTRCLGSGDIAARYGGEEFVVILPGKAQKDAFAFAEKVRREIEANKFYLRRVESRVTASLGVASYPEHGRTKEELIRTVDNNLYQAKNSGRNRVCGNT